VLFKSKSSRPQHNAMKHPFSLTFLFALFLSGCETALMSAPTTDRVTPPPSTLTVFAATSLTDAFTEIGKIFETAHPGVNVTFNFANAQSLRTQIEEGAPADVFASANTKEMDALVTNGFVAQDAPQIFLTNKLVVILPPNNPAALEKLEDLTNPGIKLVLAAEEVPVGKYARQALDQMNGQFGSDFKDKVLANIVSNEDNVKQVVAKVQLGEADAGIVYISDAVAAPDLGTIEIPADLNVTAKYPIAPLTKSENADLAAEFVVFIRSPKSGVILQKWGFGPIE
jgi:molybdate transport system substrate-binding protein